MPFLDLRQQVRGAYFLSDVFRPREIRAWEPYQRLMAPEHLEEWVGAVICALDGGWLVLILFFDARISCAAKRWIRHLLSEASPELESALRRFRLLGERGLDRVLSDLHLRGASLIVRPSRHGNEVVQALPGGHSSLAELVDGAVGELVRRGLVASLWRRLRIEFPDRTIAIDHIAALWSNQVL